MSDSTPSAQPTPLRIEPIRRDLEELPQAIANRVMRDRHAELVQLHRGLPTMLANIARISGATWKAVSVLSLDKRDGELPPRELAVSVPLLARSFLESAMTVVFVGEETHNRVTWYYRSGWCEAVAEYRTREKRFAGTDGWDAWSKLHLTWIESHDLDLKITDEEKAKPELAVSKWAKATKSKGYWPNPGRMPALVVDETRREFLMTLREWSYGQLSQDAHLTYLGLARRAAPLSHGQTSANRDRYRSGVAVAAVTLYLVLLSELAELAGLDAERQRLKKVWQHVRVIRDVNDLCRVRYDGLLGMTPIESDRPDEA